MGINITEIGQKVLDNNTNAANVFRKMYDLHYNSNPLDVPFEYIDENGNKVTTTIKNQAGFRKKVWDDVGSALGQFNRTFYVDVENGDDNNSGDSSHPFKTIKKAVDSVPIGGFGSITLAYGTYEFNTTTSLINKIVRLNGIKDSNGNYPVVSFKENPDNLGNLFHFDIHNSSLNTYNIKFDIPAPTNDVTSTINSGRYAVALRNNGRFYMYQSDVDIDDNDNGYFILAGNYNWNSENGLGGMGTLSTCNIVANKYLFCVGESAFLNISSDLSIKDTDGNDRNIVDCVLNIVKDADSGNPINLISNINFSD